MDSTIIDGISRFSGNRARTGDGTSRGGVRYPSPFFDIGHTYLPPTMKALLKWCRYYYLVNPLINSVIHKMSEYPITELVLDEKDPKVKEKWETILETDLRIRAFQIEVGLDYHTYGMCLVTIHFPFIKYLVCRNCKHEDKAEKTNYKWRNLEYIMACRKCKTIAPAIVKDAYVKDVRRIRLQRWNPENVHIEQGFAGADPIYTFEIPIQLKNDLIQGKTHILNTIPDIFIEAMRRNKNIRFSDENIFVFKRPIISQKDNGWGMPLILPVLKDTFYLQVLRKAQEAIAQEHIVPLRILFPQANGATSDPYTTTDLGNWRSRIEGELAKWKYDQNYIPIMPLPLGNQIIGGEGKALGLHQEMTVWSDQIVAGMGVPREFVFGGLSYSGSNVSMRMLENMFIGYRTDHHTMLNKFVIKRIANFMGWPTVKAYMTRFKMADDLQRSAFFFQLNQAQKISDQSLLQEVDFDPALEKARIKTEQSNLLEEQRKIQVAQAGIQGEAMLIQSSYQQKAQAMGMPPGGAVDPATGQPTDPMGQMQEGINQMMGGGPTSGAEGEMIPGPQADSAMPPTSTVSPENAQQAPNEGIPQEMASPLTMGQKGGGYNILYLARRAATELEKYDEVTKYAELNKMRMTNPQLYMVTLQLLQSSKGSQTDPLDPIQSPQPEVKPSRRPSPTGV